MSVTGIALILFLTFHASMNVVALISAKGYNMICEFLGANWYAVVATIGLAGLVALHFRTGRLVVPASMLSPVSLTR